MSDSGNVPQVQGTGLRQFAGILSVVDLSGNNIATFTSSAVVLGNSTDTPLVEIITPFIQVSDPTGPVIGLQNTSAALNQKNIIIRNTIPGAFAISSANDATPSTAAVNLISAQRSGALWPSITFGNGGTRVAGGGITAGTPIDMTPDQGSFAGNWSGFGGAPTSVVLWYKVGPVVTMFISPFLGTSTSNVLSLAGLPSALIPASVDAWVSCPGYSFEDNFATVLIPVSAIVESAPDGAAIVFVINGGSNIWTPSGTKGLARPIIITYLLF